MLALGRLSGALIVAGLAAFKVLVQPPDGPELLVPYTAHQLEEELEEEAPVEPTPAPEVRCSQGPPPRWEACVRYLLNEDDGGYRWLFGITAPGWFSAGWAFSGCCRREPRQSRRPARRVAGPVALPPRHPAPRALQ